MFNWGVIIMVDLKRARWFALGFVFRWSLVGVLVIIIFLFSICRGVVECVVGWGWVGCFVLRHICLVIFDCLCSSVAVFVFMYIFELVVVLLLSLYVLVLVMLVMMVLDVVVGLELFLLVIWC